ncbi:uncharacterized protein LOC130988946 isoform X2 [Salvia miltiorrhiza]|uniref:uncharacterized protein LOC130988946 isoform X2 n=1 Tax=Salvia miltiorrhiza TaxID=226208 RepID=UPI0025AD1920|nr:uncharacterized protein LOC130988946 isoform X2 [Salvia miltiorrhiza]
MAQLKETNNGTRTGRFSKSPSTDPYVLVLVIDDFKLEKCVDGLFDSFARLDSRIYSVGQTAANVGDHLQVKMLKKEHKKAEEHEKAKDRDPNNLISSTITSSIQSFSVM